MQKQKSLEKNCLPYKISLQGHLLFYGSHWTLRLPLHSAFSCPTLAARPIYLSTYIDRTIESDYPQQQKLPCLFSQ